MSEHVCAQQTAPAATPSTAPTQPPAEGPVLGLVELGRQIAEKLRLLEQCWPRGSHAAMNRTILEFYNALDADRHLAPLRQEAARLFQRDDVLTNVVQMVMHPDSEGCLAVDLDTQVALRRWAAAELRSAK